MNKKRRHHHVWQHYLSSWKSTDKIMCARDGRIFQVKTRNIANIRDFYKIKEMNSNELNFAMKLCSLGDSGLSEINKQWPILFNLVHDLKKQIKPEQASQNVELLIHNLYEELHSHIEGYSIKYLDALKQGDSSFFDISESKIEFIFFVIMQYVRTSKMKHQVLSAFSEDESLTRAGINIENCWSVFQLCTATQIAHSVSQDRSYKLIFLDATQNEKFVTSDQPVINLDQSNDTNDGPSTFELYYPISPEKAILLVKEPQNTNKDSTPISDEDIKIYNQLMKENSLEQIYSSSKEQLEKVLA